MARVSSSCGSGSSTSPPHSVLSKAINAAGPHQPQEPLVVAVVAALVGIHEGEVVRPLSTVREQPVERLRRWSRSGGRSCRSRPPRPSTSVPPRSTPRRRRSRPPAVFRQAKGHGGRRVPGEGADLDTPPRSGQLGQHREEGTLFRVLSACRAVGHLRSPPAAGQEPRAHERRPRQHTQRGPQRCPSSCSPWPDSRCGSRGRTPSAGRSRDQC